jgi:hypothetical protein
MSRVAERLPDVLDYHLHFIRDASSLLGSVI